MFSSRLKWETAPNRLMQAVEARRANGAPILDLTQSNPTQAGIVYPAGMLSAFSDPRAMQYDPDPRGLLFAREAVARHFSCDVERIVMTASTSEAYSWLFKLLCDPGEEVLVPCPSYPLFDYLAALESVQVKQYPLRYHEGWWLDFEDLERAITPKTRALVVVNPNNPTGSYVKPGDLTRLNEICRKHNLALISDEVFSGYVLHGEAHSLLDNNGVLTFCLNGLSKLIGLPQVKLGWIIAGGPGHAEALTKIDHIADTYLSVGTPVQYALPSLLALRPSIEGQIKERCRTNLARLDGALYVEGGWYAVIQIPRTRTEEEWALLLLQDHGVLVQPGYFYDFEREAFLVLSLLTEPSVFQDGMQRIAHSLLS